MICRNVGYGDPGNGCSGRRMRAEAPGPSPGKVHGAVSELARDSITERTPAAGEFKFLSFQ